VGLLSAISKRFELLVYKTMYDDLENLGSGSFLRGSFRRGSFRRGSFRRGVISSRGYFVTGSFHRGSFCRVP
jgi:hypothetical protein